MRKVFVLLCVVFGVGALGFVSKMWTPAAADTGQITVAHANVGQPNSNADGDGEFIIRCPMTGEVQRIDPIMDPGVGGVAPHVHMFFGNPNGVDNVQSTSTYTEMNGTANESNTTCQDKNDTAAYWAPESFLDGNTNGPDCVAQQNGTDNYVCPFLPGCTLKSNKSGNYKCGSATGSTIYIRAYYLSTSNSDPAELPPGTVMIVGSPDATTPPANVPPGQAVIYWDCGANPSVQTPESIWPYTCPPYKDDPGFPPSQQEGLTEVVSFPSCFDGDKSFTSPNGSGPNGDTKVPGYLDPNVAKGMSSPPPNDLVYPPCDQTIKGKDFDITVPHLSMRIHYVGLGLPGGSSISDNGNPIDPSSCTQAVGVTNCVTQANSPTNVALQLSSTQTSGGPGPWYTEHADYWQTWQQGTGTGPLPPSAQPGGTGTLNSLTYYCLDLANTCSFIENDNYPPPPG